jgi:hypothetical protein
MALNKERKERERMERTRPWVVFVNDESGYNKHKET